MLVWKVATTDAFDEWFAELGKAPRGGEAQVEVMAKVELLKILGPSLGRPHADTLNGSKHKNMKELRADTRESVLRTAFAFDPNRCAILLCAGNKAGVSTKHEAVLQAVHRMGRSPVRRAPTCTENRQKREVRLGMAKTFDELVKRTTTTATRERAVRRSRVLLAELFLSEVRRLAGKSQRELAKMLGIKQPSLSKLESQDDMQLSTLRRIVEALGGELRVLARFPQGTVRVKPFDRPRRAKSARCDREVSLV